MTSTQDEVEIGYDISNEFFRLSRLDEGVEAWTRLWEALA